MTAPVPTPDAGEPVVALVLTPERWVQRFHRHCADHGGVRVHHVVVDPAAALTDDYDVLVVGARWPALTPGLEAELTRRRRRVLTVDGDPEPTSVVADVRNLVERVAVAGDVEPSTDGPVGPLPTGPSGNAPDGPGVWVVGGPAGAGATEVALGLGAAAVRHGQRAVVVDAAIDAPGVAPRCGLPLEPNLVTALDAVAFAPANVVHTCFDLGDDWPVVLGGPLPDASARWPAITAVLDALADRFDVVVCDVGPLTTPAVAAATLGRADAVVAVGTGTPTGTVRLVDWIRDRAPTRPPLVVVDRAPVQRARRAQITEEITGEVAVAGVWFVPRDPRVDRAVWTAGLPGRGPFTRAIDLLWKDRGVAARVATGRP